MANTFATIPLVLVWRVCRSRIAVSLTGSTIAPITILHCSSRLFDQGSEADGIEVHPIGGHTTGFTIYPIEEVLFVCDLAFPADGQMRFNPYGPQDRTRQGGDKLYAVLKGRSLRKVCGWELCGSEGAL